MSIEELNSYRRKFLTFFEGKQHLIYPSASLKSEDPHLLFSVAGMQQFKPYFQGATPKFSGYEGVWPRVTTSQKCMRAGGKDSDIDNVGRTRRHHTFFEMLGNFSFGDYFKEGAARFAWEFLTSKEWLGLDPERLYVTIYEDDDEALDIWVNKVGVPAERVSRFGQDDNYWPANAIKDKRYGPCGPCSELFYDRGEEYGSADETGPNTGSGDRFMEIYNLVFMQYDHKESGELVPLPQQNIDTGMGFERLVTVLTGAPDAYATELFQPTIRKVVAKSGVAYEDMKSLGHRIIADHARSVAFAISDGILPANDGAGYVIKMLIRRASRQAYLLGIDEPFLYSLVEAIAESMGDAYPAIVENQARVASIIKNEEEQFLRTLSAGIVRFNKVLDELDGDTIPGDIVFDLWQTYGFAPDLSEEMAAERDIAIDKDGYQVARAKARKASKGASSDVDIFKSEKDSLGALASEHGETIFVGYEQLEQESTLIALLNDEDDLLNSVGEGESARAILKESPFYAESGGQVGDKGVLEWPGGKALVRDTQKSKEGIYQHKIKVLRGELHLGQGLRAVVDGDRAEIAKHHSATHLLHSALRNVLGDHVAQAGSLVSAERLRFDFSHTQALSPADIANIERLCNRWIQANIPVTWEYMPIAEARKTGAMMLFGEKYGEIVRVVRMGDSIDGPSTELCGGTHVDATGAIGSFVVQSEESVSAGVRRVEAVVGRAAFEHIQAIKEEQAAIARALNAKSGQVLERIERLQSDLKAREREARGLRDKLAANQLENLGSLKEVNGIRYISGILEGLDGAALRNAADSLSKRSSADIVLLASGTMLVALSSQEGQAKGVHAGNTIRAVAKRAGGGGGGKADLAQAGVIDSGKIPAAIEALAEILAA